MNVDRDQSRTAGLTQRDVTSSMLISLSSERPGSAHAMAGLGQRRQLHRRRADSAVPHGFARAHCCERRLRLPVVVNYATRRARSRARRIADNSAVGAGPNQTSQAYGNPGRGLRRTANALQHGDRATRRRPGDRQSLQRAAGLRCLRQRRPARSGRASVRRSRRS